ncbi:MAG TPA: PCRF domain-containing protein, partial [Fimbriimonas sp.]
MQQIEEQASQPDFWSDPTAANKAQQRLSRLKNIAAPFDELDKFERDVAELYEMIHEDPSPELEAEADQMALEFLKKLDQYELRTLLSGEHDGRNAILEVNAGAGGSEACDWAQMLQRMYARWAQEKDFKMEILSETP